MSEVGGGDGSKAAFVNDVIEHIRRCHERIVILHAGARALIEKVHRDLQIARDRVQQAEARAAAAKARADAAEAKFQKLAWLVRSQLLPAIEDEGFSSLSVTHIVQPGSASKEPSPELASNERLVLDHSVPGGLMEYRRFSEGRSLTRNTNLGHKA
jgi:hypothetical protein